jgi:WXG100 family type VII secretion target
MRVTRFQVDSDEVLSATSAARASIARISAEVNGLLAQLTSLQGSWSGQAAMAFQGIVAEWRGTQQRVEESMASINAALGRAADQYAQIEAANTRLFSR